MFGSDACRYRFEPVPFGMQYARLFHPFRVSFGRHSYPRVITLGHSLAPRRGFRE